MSNQTPWKTVLKWFVAVWFLGLFAAVFLAVFVTGPGPVDGLGRPLTESPRLMRLIFGQERMWAGPAWFLVDMVVFWGSIGLGAYLLNWFWDE